MSLICVSCLNRYKSLKKELQLLERRENRSDKVQISAGLNTKSMGLELIRNRFRIRSKRNLRNFIFEGR